MIDGVSCVSTLDNFLLNYMQVIRWATDLKSYQKLFEMVVFLLGFYQSVFVNPLICNIYNIVRDLPGGS